jgi:WD40 repeat protein
LFCSTSIIDNIFANVEQSNIINSNNIEKSNNNVFVKVLDIDESGFIYCGCSDGSIRVFKIEIVLDELKITQVFKFLNAHNGPVNAIAVSKNNIINKKQIYINKNNQEEELFSIENNICCFVVSGGEDCIVRVWKTIIE